MNGDESSSAIQDLPLYLVADCKCNAGGGEGHDGKLRKNGWEVMEQHFEETYHTAVVKAGEEIAGRRSRRLG